MLYIAKNIKALRVEKGLSQSSLASQLGVVPGTISNYENSVSTPDLEMLGELTKVLGVSVHDLLYEDLSGKNFNTKTPKNVINANDNKNDNNFDNKPKLRKTLSNAAGNLNPKTQKNVTVEKGNIPKIHETLPFEAGERGLNLPATGEANYQATAIHGAGTALDYGAAQISEVAEPTAGYDPSLESLRSPLKENKNVFTGLTQDEVEEELKDGIRDVIMEMYENGEAYPAVVVRQYQEQIKELVGQLARLEYQLQELGFTQIGGVWRPGREEGESKGGGRQIKKSR